MKKIFLIFGVVTILLFVGCNNGKGDIMNEKNIKYSEGVYLDKNWDEFETIIDDLFK